MMRNEREIARALRELHAVALGTRETLVRLPMGDFNRLIAEAAAALERRDAGPGSREGEELARRLRSLADAGIVNARADADTLRRAADWIENADERIAIMAESLGGGLPLIRRGGNVDLLAALDEGKRFSGLTEEE